MLRILALLLLCGAACAQTVTYSYQGYTECSYNYLSVSPGAVTRAFGVSGNVRLNLAAGVNRIPNAPISAGFVTGGPAIAYPIIFINGSTQMFGIGTPNISTVQGIVQPAYLYMDILNGANSQTGFDRDPDFAFFLDTDGIRLTTNSSTSPQVHIVLDTPSNNQAYNIPALKAQGFPNTVFSVTRCSTNTFTITRNVTPPPSSSTGPAQPSNPGAVGDPSFSGFRGQRYQIHGVADTVYNIISDENIVLNAEFVFLTSGKCPILNGKPMTNCWSHAGSYFGSLGLQTINGDELIIQSGSAKQGWASILFNNQSITSVGSLTGLSGSSAAVTLQMKNTHQITLNTGLFEFELENSDNFINIVSVSISDWRELTHKVKSHGLLGQTWELRKGVIQGQVDDYAEANNQLLGHQFLYNKFQPKSE